MKGRREGNMVLPAVRVLQAETTAGAKEVTLCHKENCSQMIKCEQEDGGQGGDRVERAGSYVPMLEDLGF